MLQVKKLNRVEQRKVSDPYEGYSPDLKADDYAKGGLAWFTRRIMRIKDFTDTIRHLTDPFNIPEARRMIQENPALSRQQFAEGQLVQPGPGRQGYAGLTKEGILKRLKTPAKGNWMTKQQLADYLKDNGLKLSKETIGKKFVERYNIPIKLPNPEKSAQGQWHWYKKPDVQQMKDMKLTEMGNYDLKELNKAAGFYGKDKFEDLPSGNSNRERYSAKGYL